MVTDPVRKIALGQLGHLSADKVDPACAESDSYTGLEDLVKDYGGRIKRSRSLPSETCIGVRKNDILIGNVRPNLRKIWLADRSGCAGRSIIVYRPDSEEALAEYLFLALSTERFFSYQERHAHGAGIPRGNKRRFLEFEVPLPTIEQQRRIVDLAGRSASRMRELVGAIASEITIRGKQSARCHTQMLCHGDADHMFPLKQLCSRIQLGPYGQFLRNGDFTETGVPVIDPDDIRRGTIGVSRCVSSERSTALSKWSVRNGDVIIARRGRFGKTAVVDRESDGRVCGTGCIFMTPDAMIDPDYLACSLSSPHAIAWFESHIPGGTMKTLDPDVLGRFPVYVPSIQEQQRIVRVLKRIGQTTDTLVDELSKEVSLRRKQYEGFLEQLIF